MFDSAGCCCHYCRSLPAPRSGYELQPPAFEGSTGFTLETSTLFGVLNEARVHKTQQEVEVLQYVSDVGSRAHIAMMQVRAVLLPVLLPLPLLLLRCCRCCSAVTCSNLCRVRGEGWGNRATCGWWGGLCKKTVNKLEGLSNTWLCL